MDAFRQIVDLVFELLHVAVRFVVLRRFWVVGAIKLFMVLLVSESDLFVDLFNDLVHILSLAHLTENVALELKHGLFDDVVVEVDHVLRNLSLELRILIHDRLQVFLPKAVCIDVMQGLVEELGLVAEEVFVTANDGLFTQLDVEVALLLVAETNAVLARLLFLLSRALRDHVDLLVDLVILFEDILLSRVETRLEMLKHCDHELRVLRVLPAVDICVQVGPLRPLPTLLLHPEVDLKQIDEVGKQEPPIDVRLDMIRQLGHEAHVDLRLDRVVLVVGPVVLEVALKPLGHLLGQRATPVEVGKQAEPLGQVLTILVISCHILQIHEDIDKLTHDVGETSDTNEQNKSRHDSLYLALGIVVTETDS